MSNARKLGGLEADQDSTYLPDWPYYVPRGREGDSLNHGHWNSEDPPRLPSWLVAGQRRLPGDEGRQCTSTWKCWRRPASASGDEEEPVPQPRSLGTSTGPPPRASKAVSALGRRLPGDEEGASATSAGDSEDLPQANISRPAKGAAGRRLPGDRRNVPQPPVLETVEDPPHPARPVLASVERPLPRKRPMDEWRTRLSGAVVPGWPKMAHGLQTEGEKCRRNSKMGRSQTPPRSIVILDLFI
ncbi:hypothetical protein AVEN_73451-1 [Araneus ventricosus]|uniref:Uncharacterized protein n=1 Tax=Araneus ventricosus TaxID=182803 RepID=A0A4Y2M030_ARAVE|nr:hypothetical protein AVEN_73451-1 [Araneus ventricosus]